ncbi:nitric oxide synthase isoform X2 [Condylostylus longicornis]|uniref:nitric oxide synthase isoform X2 n=1 Tax=Condylostylus longicornis TaxID=2530218 RepID=UPI00244DD33D|nr:nitric oxide synthase isoform X2 [Condylostylus longicornis]
MMSHHFNSMLEHLKIGSLRNRKDTNSDQSPTSTSNIEVGNSSCNNITNNLNDSNYTTTATTTSTITPINVTTDNNIITNSTTIIGFTNPFRQQSQNQQQQQQQQQQNHKNLIKNNDSNNDIIVDRNFLYNKNNSNCNNSKNIDNKSGICDDGIDNINDDGGGGGCGGANNQTNQVLNGVSTISTALKNNISLIQNYTSNNTTTATNKTTSTILNNVNNDIENNTNISNISNNQITQNHIVVKKNINQNSNDYNIQNNLKNPKKPSTSSTSNTPETIIKNRSNQNINRKTSITNPNDSSNMSTNNSSPVTSMKGTPIKKLQQQDGRKRPSISVPNGDCIDDNGSRRSIIDSAIATSAAIIGNDNTTNNSDVKETREKSTSSSRTRELSPTPRQQQRKLSTDMRDVRSRAGSVNLDEDGRPILIRKPVKLKNVASRAETYDTLHAKATSVLQCSRGVCMGSVMNFSTMNNDIRKPDIVLDHAKDFLDQYFTSIRRHGSPAHETRWQQVQKEIEENGSYQLTETELIYGAKLAWRNSSRCIGRIQWSKLQVFDCRYVTTTSGMFEAICNHIKYATNKGNLRSAITIFPQRTDGRHDYRIWNSQLISYAGYRQPDGSIIGDPINVEFTEVCMTLGWKGKNTQWDILPLVVSANGHDPDYFDYPPELILEVPLSHPALKWFADLNLRWYALPAVSGMLFDCGGIQFSATAFSGWYMSTEIGCRDLCDTNRLNILEDVALKMDLDTRTSTTLWKDKALVEVNLAVLYSFQSKNITIVDHHTASESFMKHFENESKLRNGCPADWIWIVPPMSSSITPVYHQEMSLYYLKPSFEYQDPAWKTHIWKKGGSIQGKSKKPRKKFHFKQIARAVKFTSKLFGRALSRRIKATVLYATETGRSEQYAKQLGELLGHAFNAQVYCMSDYDISSIEHEALLIVIASTFGNGDPPENGEEFAQGLYAMKLQESGDIIDGQELNVTVSSSKSFMKVNSRQEIGKIVLQQFKKIDRLDSLRGSTSETLTSETFGPLSNVRFAVFALGSSAYPNFCAFGKFIDNILGELGGERLLKLSFGDEMCGQEQSFRKWAPEVFRAACETFCLDPDENLSDASLQGEILTTNTVRFVPVKERKPLEQLLTKYHNKKVSKYHIKRRPINLHGDCIDNTQNRATILVEILAPGVKYEPGDHVGIYPANRKEIVDGLIKRITDIENPDEIVELQILREKQTSSGIFKNWEPHEKIPPNSIRELLSRFFDITTPPSRQLLTMLGTFCDDKNDQDRINILVNESSAYEDWRHWKLPTLLDVLEEFPSCKIPISLLLPHLTPLQPRFYSISSSLRKYRNEIHLTVGVVKYRSEDGEGAEHYGVCSNYLDCMQDNDSIYLFVRSAPSFHLPNDLRPAILIGPGTGIAPFRSFWQELEIRKSENTDSEMPKIWLFFGCRLRSLDLYREEKEEMKSLGVLNRVFLALSREADVPKTYVQDLAARESDDLYNLIVTEKGHIYVCGDVTMAEHVYQTIRKIIAMKEQRPESDVEKFLLSLRDENRYHEDIFGITLRTAEIHNKSRATARIRMASQPT